MANRSSTTDDVPKFAHGLKILLVDHDTNYLTYTASVLSQYSVNVAAIQEASKALPLINDQKNNQYELAMANVNLFDRDSLSFLHALLEMDIPIILMSSDLTHNLMRKAVDKGVNFFLQKPIPLEELKKVWQLVYGKGNNPNQDIVSDSSEDSEDWIDWLTNSLETHEEDLHNQNASGKKHSADNNIGQGKMKRMKSNVEKAIPDYKGKNQEGIVKRSNEKNKKKRRIVWTPNLHYMFLTAISYLGDEKARPKAILKMMCVKGVTMRQIGSHLQKYKNQVMQIYLNTGIFTRITTSKFGGQGRHVASATPPISSFISSIPAASLNNHDNNRMLNLHSSQEMLSRYGNHDAINPNQSIRTDGWSQHIKATENPAVYQQQHCPPALTEQQVSTEGLEQNKMTPPNMSYLTPDVTQEQVFFNEFEDPFSIEFEPSALPDLMLMNSPSMNYKSPEDANALNQEKSYHALANPTTSEDAGSDEVADFLLESPSEENKTDDIQLPKEPLYMIKLDQPSDQIENKSSETEKPTETPLSDANNLGQKSLDPSAISSDENDAEYADLLKIIEAEAENNSIGNAHMQVTFMISLNG